MQDSKYLVANDRDAQWGLVVNTVGYDEVGPDEPYPTKGHGDGYYFDPERGRILDEYRDALPGGRRGSVLFTACYRRTDKGRRHIPTVPRRMAYIPPTARNVLEELLDRLQRAQHGRQTEVQLPVARKANLPRWLQQRHCTPIQVGHRDGKGGARTHATDTRGNNQQPDRLDVFARTQHGA